MKSFRHFDAVFTNTTVLQLLCVSLSAARTSILKKRRHATPMLLPMQMQMQDSRWQRKCGRILLAATGEYRPTKLTAVSEPSGNSAYNCSIRPATDGARYLAPRWNEQVPGHVTRRPSLSLPLAIASKSDAVQWSLRCRFGLVARTLSHWAQ